MFKKTTSLKLLYVILVFPTCIELLGYIEWVHSYVVIGANILLTGILFLIIQHILTLTSHLEMKSYKDALTGLFNRRSFEVEIEKQFEFCSRTKSELVLLYIGQTGLKQPK